MVPSLHTERFQLLAFEADDLSFLFRGLSHPEVIPYYGVRYESREATKAQLLFYRRLEESGEGLWWKICDLLTGEKLGAVGFNNYQYRHRKAEVGYWLLPEHWKKGILTEVLPVVLRYLFTVKQVHRVEALVETGNERSAGVLLRCGFTYEGTLRDCEIKEGRFISLQVFSLLSA